VSARSKARKRAVDILFEADQRPGTDLRALLDERVRTSGSPAPLPQYAIDVVEGVHDHAERIDEILGTYSRGWTLVRMPAVDRAILRVGTWEILFNDEVPDAVAVDEAVDLARSLSTDDSPAFINGLLGRILELKPALLA
jgi:N utilization substance protein B